jgi:RNA polymerase sigma-70 factor (ECF subfamily)
MADTQTYSDEELVAHLKEDRESALSELYNRYWDRLLSVAINRLGIEAEAEECVQDVFVSLWRRRHEIELRYSLSTYLWVAVKHQVINRLDNRYAKRTLRTTELVDETIVPSSEEQLLEKELREQIAATVSRLPEKCRMVYHLSREEGKSNKEIAEELNISEKTVEGHVTRALRDIRTDLTLLAPAFVVYSILKEIHHQL